MNSWNIIHGPLIELKRSHNLMFIGTLFQFYQWAVDNVLGVHFCYCSTEEYERQKIFLQTRFGTHKLYSFIPISKDTLRTRVYSFSTITRENYHRTKIWISCMQEICRIGQDFLYISFVCVTFCPILCRICVGNVSKCHALVHRIRRKSYIWSSVCYQATSCR